jgi:hypothetical protein
MVLQLVGQVAVSETVKNPTAKQDMHLTCWIITLDGRMTAYGRKANKH